MEEITSGLGCLSTAAPILAATIIWMSPEMLRWAIKKLAMRVSYIEAGRSAAEIEKTRLEAEWQCPT